MTSQEDRTPAPGLHRRELLAGAGLLATALASGESARAVTPTPATGAAASQTSAAAPGEAMLTLNATEQAFLTAAVDRLIPADTLSPSASDCGVVTFIDRQLAGAWGGGARLYRSGPFLSGKPEHGYQLPLTPREYFAAGIAAVNDWTREQHGKPFDLLQPEVQDAVLHQLEKRETMVGDIPAAPFFDALLAITMEGFFADPIYGGNRDNAGWKLVGYPGLPATYARAIQEYRGRRYEAAPKSIGDFL